MTKWGRYAELGAIAEGTQGLFTARQAAEIGVSYKALTNLSSRGVVHRVAQGVYRMTGAPELEHEHILAMWLALGGATRPPTSAGVPAVVAAGQTAAQLHDIGDFYPGRPEFIVPARRGSRLPVTLRSRPLQPTDLIPVHGIPTLTPERTIGDLAARWVDTSLVADTLADAADQGKITSPAALVDALSTTANAHGYPDGAAIAARLSSIGGVTIPGLPS